MRGSPAIVATGTGDEPARVTWVPEGMQRALARRGALGARVRNGYLVVVTACRAAAMLHLSFDTMTTPDTQPLEAKVARLAHLATEAQLGAGRWHVEVIGGADPGGMLPSQVRLTHGHHGGKVLASVLEAAGLVVTRSRIGGHHEREVVVDVASGEISVLAVRPPAASRPSVVPPQVVVPQLHMVDMGDLVVASSPDVLSAILGSCVGIGMYDPQAAVGGLAHVMMPNSDGRVDAKARFADTAVEALVAELEARGGKRQRLSVKLAGGARVLSVGEDNALGHIADKNIVSAEAALEAARLTVVAKDVGGNVGRKIWIDLRDFTLRVKMLGSGHRSA